MNSLLMSDKGKGKVAEGRISERVTEAMPFLKHFWTLATAFLTRRVQRTESQKVIESECAC